MDAEFDNESINGVSNRVEIHVKYAIYGLRIFRLLSLCI